VRPAKLELAILESRDLKALLVNRTMVATAQQDEVGEGRRPSLSPVLDMMRLAERQVAAREAATVVSIGECAAQGRRNRPRPRADLHDDAIGIVTHLHPAGIARQPLGRFRGNARAAFWGAP
jgi:hypothetical protein